jgi:1,4-dihydroxy-2-naphthoyl-CoA hydrolase
MEDSNTPDLAKLRQLIDISQGSFIELLGVKFLKISTDLVSASLEITPKLLQPFGKLHGGVTLSLAETVSSIGSWYCIDAEFFSAVGMEVNANHLKSVANGTIIATAIPLHIGNRSHVWEVKINHVNSGGLIAVSRCTNAIIPKT